MQREAVTGPEEHAALHQQAANFATARTSLCLHYAQGAEVRNCLSQVGGSRVEPGDYNGQAVYVFVKVKVQSYTQQEPSASCTKRWAWAKPASQMAQVEQYLRKAGGSLVDPDDVQHQAVCVLRGLDVQPHLGGSPSLPHSPLRHAALQQRLEATLILHKTTRRLCVRGQLHSWPGRQAAVLPAWTALPCNWALQQACS